MLLAPELFRIHALAGTRLEGEECNILHEAWRSLRDGVQEEAVAKAARELRKDKGRGTVKSTEFTVRSMSPMTKTFDTVSLNSTMICASLDMQAASRPWSS
jgi:hypothetical protein